MGRNPPVQRSNSRGFLNRLLVWSARIIEDDDEAIWSVPRPFKRAYSIALSAICSPLLIAIVIEKIQTTESAGWWTNVTAVTSSSATEFAPIGIGVAIALLVIAHIGAVIVSLYHMIANRWVKPVVEEHIAQGREEGREEVRAELEPVIEKLQDEIRQLRNGHAAPEPTEE